MIDIMDDEANRMVQFIVSAPTNRHKATCMVKFLGTFKTINGQIKSFHRH